MFAARRSAPRLLGYAASALLRGPLGAQSAGLSNSIPVPPTLSFLRSSFVGSLGAFQQGFAASYSTGSGSKDFYTTLGVSKTASESDIKKAYRVAAKKWHPDLHQGKSSEKEAEKKFKEISEAYQVLSDPTLRAQHDAQRQYGGGQGQARGGGHPFGQGFRGQPGGFGGMGGMGFEDMRSGGFRRVDPEEAERLFMMMMRGMGPMGMNRQNVSPQQMAELERQLREMMKQQGAGGGFPGGMGGAGAQRGGRSGWGGFEGYEGFQGQNRSAEQEEVIMEEITQPDGTRIMRRTTRVRDFRGNILSQQVEERILERGRQHQSTAGMGGMGGMGSSASWKVGGFAGGILAIMVGIASAFLLTVGLFITTIGAGVRKGIRSALNRTIGK